FQITVTNAGNATLTGTHVDDALAPDCSRTAAQIAAIAPHGATFLAGDTFNYSCTQANVTASYVNTAVATGTPPVGADVTDSDIANVTVINPAISIDKGTSSQTIVSGTQATFSITVTNSGDSTLNDVHVTDALSPDCVRTAAQIAADRGSSTFAVGDTYSYACSLPNVAASFTNSATATGTPLAGPD